MQIFKPLKTSYFFKKFFIFILSILLYACNSNFIDVQTKTESDEILTEKPEISETQINIDELLIEKEIIQPIDLPNLEKIAILLPMTGKYSKIGKTIYEGIEIEFGNNLGKNKPQITIHDTGDKDINLKKIYYELIDQDYNYVIGPLRKDLLNKLLNYSSEKLPILTLNYLNNYKKINKQVYQFGLLPEDEAICIAEKAIIDGNSKASILYPENTWGKRISESFSLRFKELGGEIIDTSEYLTNNKDDRKINISIRNLLKIEESIKRKKKLEDILNIKLQYKPFVSNNLDMMFSVGTAKYMRVIKPQFNFNYAEDLPFYSTSHIYNGVYDKLNNQDLNNIKFCDIPWLYNKKNLMIKNTLNESADKKDLLRFIAIGMDSVKILYNIEKLKNNKDKFLFGDTGYLQLDEFNRIRRHLIIVEFKNGKAKKVPF